MAGARGTQDYSKSNEGSGKRNRLACSKSNVVLVDESNY